MGGISPLTVLRVGVFHLRLNGWSLIVGKNRLSQRGGRGKGDLPHSEVLWYFMNHYRDRQLLHTGIMVTLNVRSQVEYFSLSHHQRTALRL